MRKTWLLHASANAVGGRSRIADFALFSTVLASISGGSLKLPRTGNGYQIGGKITGDGERITTVHGYQIGKNESLATVHGSFGTI